jgi:CBS-domain-containing membrane protein
MVRRFLHRHQSRNDVISLLKSGFGAALAMGVIGFFGQLSDLPFLIAPFGASCVLLFSVPSSPLSQPMNVIGGHMVASALALALRTVLPPEWWAISLVVGLAIAVMALLRITHPPAGADPVVVFLADPGWSFLFVPILAGCMVMIGIATLVHMIPKRTIYPLVLQDVLQENDPDQKKLKR